MQNRPDRALPRKQLKPLADDVAFDTGGQPQFAKYSSAMTLSECRKVLVHEQDEQALLEQICSTLVSVGGYAMALIGFENREAGKPISVAASAGAEAEVLQSFASRSAVWLEADGPVGNALQTHRPFISSHPAPQGQVMPWQQLLPDNGAFSCCVLPFACADHPDAFLYLHSVQANTFQPEETAWLEELTQELSLRLRQLTEQKHTGLVENQWRENENQFRSIVEAADEAIGTIDLNGNICYLNRAAENLFGYSLAEVINKPVTLLMVEKTATAFGEMLHILNTTGTFASQGQTLELWHKSRDGSEILLEMRYACWTAGDQRFITAIMRDITRRNHIEHLLHESESRYRRLVENSFDIIFEWEVGQGLRYINPIISEIIGYSAEELLRDQQKAVQLVLIDGQTPISGSKKLWDWMRDKKYFEMVVRHKTQGHDVIFETRLIPEKDRAGNLIGVEGILRDITERKKAEKEREKLQQQLLHSQKMEAIGMLAGGMAHDLNNLLTPIIGYSEMGLMNLNPTEPLHADLMQILEAGERAQELIRQLLAFSRKQTLELKIIRLDEQVAALSKMLRRIIKESVDINYRHSTSLGSIRADASQIQQIIINLAMNANDAMPQGGTLTIETANVDLDETYCSGHSGAWPGAFAMLVVNDSGAGMDEETCSRIFEPFFTTKEIGRGTGLGLATVHGIVTQHGGHIEVSSQPGVGTRFSIYLPRVDLLPTAVAPRLKPDTAKGLETILVVEDDRMVRKLAERVLVQKGYNVFAAENPEMALLIVQEQTEPIDLLLTDLVMPQMNGKALYAVISARMPGLKVLYMSGYTHDIISHHEMLKDQIRFIAKPFAIDALALMVRQVLDE